MQGRYRVQCNDLTMTRVRLAFVLVAAACLMMPAATAIDNGLGVTPPRGWRSWNQFGTNIHQDLVEAQYAALVDRRRVEINKGGAG